MNLRQLYYFRTIAELEHYTRAAEKLFVSQSNLSHAIQELEEELNVKLFVRKGRNIKLTKYGELFLPYVQKSIEDLEAGISTLKDYINPDSGTVSMVGFPSLTNFVTDIIVQYLSETNRINVKFHFSQESFYDIQSQLLAGKADLALGTRIDNPNVECVHLGEHQLALLVPMHHRLAQRDSIDLRELDGENFISFDERSQLHHQTKELFQRLGIHPNIVMETPQDVIVYGLVAANRGVAITPAPLGGIPHNIKVLPIANDIPKRDLYLMWNKNRYIPPAAEYFRDFIVRSGRVFDQFLAHNGPAIV